MEQISEIKRLVAQDKLTIGTNKVMKSLRAKKMKKIFISNNCPAELESDIDKYAKLSGTEVVKLDIPNEEFGVVCKKPFFVSVAGVQQ